MLGLGQLIAQSCYPFLKLVDLQLQGEDHLRIPAFAEVLVCPLILLGGGSRSLELLALAAQYLLGSTGLYGGEFVIQIVLLGSFIEGEAVPEGGVAFAALCLFVERRRLFLGKLTFKITASAINTFALFGFPGGEAELECGFCLPLPLADHHPNCLPPIPHGIRTAPANLFPTGFLPVCSQYNYNLNESGVTLGAASSMVFSVRRKSLVAKSMTPPRQGLKEVEAEVYLSG